MRFKKFDFESLTVYQKSLDYIDFVYNCTLNFPAHELYALSSQFRRAAQSIALNLAEGYGESFSNLNRFLNISRGSIRECVVCSTISFRRNYITEDIYIELRKKLTELSKMLAGLKKYIQKQQELQKTH